MTARRILYIALSILLIMAFLPMKAQAETLTQTSTPSCPPLDIEQIKRDPALLRSLPAECTKAYREFMHTPENKMNTQDVFPTVIGGPDQFGYTYDDAVSYSWISAATNTGLDGDDASMSQSIGFDFPFYGINYSELWFNTNGGITFGEFSTGYGGFIIPSTGTPNNLIAPFWEDLLVGAPYNSGAIFYSQGGTIPNRYLVLEWRDVTTWSGSAPFSFEVILHENGDIVTQLQSLPASYYSTVGIENSLGDEGLLYQFGSSGLSAPMAIRFYYPTTPTARIQISPLTSGGFSSPAGTNDFTITITNTGTMGADTYDLTVASPWPVTFYASNGITLLTDTDSDLTVDTGAIPQGGIINIKARVATPGGAVLGDSNTAEITAVSSLDVGKNRSATVYSSIPAAFAQIYKDEADGAMSLNLIQPNLQVVKKATADLYPANNIATNVSPNGNFIYSWSTYYFGDNAFVRDIEFTLLDHSGNTVRAVSKLTNNNAAAISTYDDSVSVATAPNGTIGITWSRYLYNDANDQVNYNIYFATLDGAGNLTSGPTNITNNAISGLSGDLNLPRFYDPVIAASDDNRFIISWEDYRKVGVTSYNYNVWYTIRDTAGAGVFSPTALTTNNISWGQVLNSLTGGKVIVTWLTETGGPNYAVINSSGSIAKSPTSLNTPGSYWAPDAVLLANGKVAIAWPVSTGIEFAILNSSYALEGGLNSANSPSSNYGYDLSVTTDHSNHVIMTWHEGYSSNLTYALGDSTGIFITQPILYKTGTGYIESSSNGQGNTPYNKFIDVPYTYWSASWIERLSAVGITGGCGTNIYCPDNTVTRAQMAVFLLRGIHGANYTPPAIGGNTGFTDVATDYWAAAWIKQLAAEAITSGCGNGNYCPEQTVTRAQMAIFLLKAKHGSSYSPPAATGAFTDVPVGYWADRWIEQLADEAVTSGCGGGNYCPDSPVTRAQMAVFLIKAFNLP